MISENFLSIVKVVWNQRNQNIQKRKEKKEKIQRKTQKYKIIEERRRRRSSKSCGDDYGCGLEPHGRQIGCSKFSGIRIS